MKIGDIEIKKIPAGENIRCQGGIPGQAIVYFDGTPYCVECLGTECLEGLHSRELVGHLLASLIREEAPRVVRTGFQKVVK
jgi:hypothetical protein